MVLAHRPVEYIGDLIQRISTSVQVHGVNPHSDVFIRIGDTGEEMQIEHVKVQGGLNGPRIVIQAKVK